jgi:hypothetical protein
MDFADTEVTGFFGVRSPPESPECITNCSRYIGSEKAIADLPFFNGNVASGGGAAMLFWRSAYIVCHILSVTAYSRCPAVYVILGSQPDASTGRLDEGQALWTVCCVECLSSQLTWEAEMFRESRRERWDTLDAFASNLFGCHEIPSDVIHPCRARSKPAPGSSDSFSDPTGQTANPNVKPELHNMKTANQRLPHP